MSKSDFIKQQLALRGIFNYTDQDFSRLKSMFIDNVTLLKMDKYTAFDRAFEVVFGRKRNVSA